MTVQDEGAQAFKNNVPPVRNPYGEGTPERDQWTEGWQAALAEYREARRRKMSGERG